MNSSQFKSNELKKLCCLVGFKPDFVQQVIDNIDSYYQEWVEKKQTRKLENLSDTKMEQ